MKAHTRETPVIVNLKKHGRVPTKHTPKEKKNSLDTGHAWKNCAYQLERKLRMKIEGVTGREERERKKNNTSEEEDFVQFYSIHVTHRFTCCL